jgi:anti-sigma factor RsiW
LRVLGEDRLRKELVLLSDDYVPVLTLEEALSYVASSEMTAAELERFARSMRISYSPGAR